LDIINNLLKGRGVNLLHFAIQV